MGVLGREGKGGVEKGEKGEKRIGGIGIRMEEEERKKKMEENNAEKFVPQKEGESLKYFFCLEGMEIGKEKKSSMTGSLIGGKEGKGISSTFSGIYPLPSSKPYSSFSPLSPSNSLLSTTTSFLSSSFSIPPSPFFDTAISGSGGRGGRPQSSPIDGGRKRERDVGEEEKGQSVGGMKKFVYSQEKVIELMEKKTGKISEMKMREGLKMIKTQETISQIQKTLSPPSTTPFSTFTLSGSSKHGLSSTFSLSSSSYPPLPLLSSSVSSVANRREILSDGLVVVARCRTNSVGARGEFDRRKRRKREKLNEVSVV
jgi:hypothetical protein